MQWAVMCVLWGWGVVHGEYHQPMFPAPPMRSPHKVTKEALFEAHNVLSTDLEMTTLAHGNVSRSVDVNKQLYIDLSSLKRFESRKWFMSRKLMMSNELQVLVLARGSRSSHLHHQVVQQQHQRHYLARAAERHRLL